MKISPAKSLPGKTTLRQIKDVLYEQVARIGKATSSPKRLELLERLAAEAQISVKLASAHLSALKAASMVETRRAGKNIFYSLAATDVANFWVTIRSLAEQRLLELQLALGKLASGCGSLATLDRGELLREAACGEVALIDVRPHPEFAAGHLPFARSIPLSELKKRIAELPGDKAVVVYCRGPFCLFASEAVSILENAGHLARRLDDGVAEWQVHGFAIER